MTRNGSFFNLYNHDFVRIAVGVPSVRVADPAFNADQTIALIREAADRKAVLALFPELGLSAYSCDDLFQQRALLDACLDAIASDGRGDRQARQSSAWSACRSRSTICSSTARS